MQKFVRKSLELLFYISIGANIWFLANWGDGHIKPRAGKDCTIEMKNFINGQWDPVIFVHGYGDNYPAAQYIVEFAEKDEAEKGGREPGSFRVVRH